MKELKMSEYQNVMHLVEGIDHNRALMYSVLENEHPGRVFVNKIDNPTFALLITKVNFIFIIGDLLFEDNDDLTLLADTISNRILIDMNEKEVILFAYSENTRQMLDKVFQQRGGIRIYRKQFKFNPDSIMFSRYTNWIESIINGFKLAKLNNDLALKTRIDSTICNFSKKAFG